MSIETELEDILYSTTWDSDEHKQNLENGIESYSPEQSIAMIKEIIRKSKIETLEKFKVDSGGCRDLAEVDELIKISIKWLNK